MANPIVTGVAGGVAYDLIKEGVKWVLREPPPPGDRPSVLYDSASQMNWHLQDDGSYQASGQRMQ